MQYLIFLKRLKHWLLDFLLIQLFINLFTWPLFLGWGIPITPLSIIGNLVFSPFLTLFLSLSSLLVMLQIFCLPYLFIIRLLEWITDCWILLVSYPVPNFMIICVTPPVWLSILAPISATYIMLNKSLKKPLTKIIALLAAYSILIGIFWLLPAPDQITISYGNHEVTVIKKDGNLTLIDPGFTRRKSGIYQWIVYTLLPELGSRLGTQSLDTIVVKKKTPSTLACAQMIKEHTHAKNVFFHE